MSPLPTPEDDYSTPSSPSITDRLRRLVLGPPRDLRDRKVYHSISVVALLAWVGLGADGLSSSAYGPEEAFRTLEQHTYLALPIALLMILTVTIISVCYSRIIDRFPNGGGGYVVATALLGPRAGVVSGSALLVDYVLTITVSIAAAGDALFSMLPPVYQEYKLPAEAMMIVGLSVINLRGVKEPILALLPVFGLFLVTHVVLIGAGVGTHVSEAPAIASGLSDGFTSGLDSLGVLGMLLLFLHAYSLGGGTYTGIEAVSNGLPIMREPRARTARHTMIYMAVSLSFMAAGLIVCYLLWQVHPVQGKTLNAVLVERVSAGWPMAGTIVALTLASEGALLVVAAQAGFIDGPRVLANMAVDSWMPRGFATMSDRLTTANGVLLMGAAAVAALLYTRGDVRHLVVMYSINVFLTFSLSMLSMVRDSLSRRRARQPWKGAFALFAVGLSFCATILAITVLEKFTSGGWLTLVVTTAVVGLCFAIRRHYSTLRRKLESLYAGLVLAPTVATGPAPRVDPSKPTAAVLVGAYSGLGLHTLLAAFRNFPDQFTNVLFLTVGVIDSGVFKGADTVDDLRRQTQENLDKYMQFAHRQGLPAEGRMAIGTDAVDELEKLCAQAAQEFRRVTFFAGQVVFKRERWYLRMLHNGTAYVLQRRLQQIDKALIILPARL